MTKSDNVVATHGALSGVVSSVAHFGEVAPDRIAVQDASGSLTYSELRDTAEGVRQHLLSRGVHRGDRVLFVAPSVPEFVAVYLGLLASGVVVVPCNTMSTQRELEYVIEDAGCSFAIAWHGSADAARVAAADADVPFWEVTPGVADVTPTPPDPNDAAPAASDPAVILYTSGTTGQPKGAVLTHGNLLACARTFSRAFEVTTDDRFGTALPLFHVFGQAVILGTVLNSGAGISLMQRFDAADMIDMIRRDGLTVLVGVPTVWTALLLAAEGLDADQFSTLRLSISGGASLPIEVVRAFKERFTATILDGYALTETCGTGTFSGLDRPRKTGSVGSALPGVQLAIRDEAGEAVPAGTIGEIYIKSPTVMQGYWGRPEATAAVLADGWLQTGDLGVLDEDGDLRIVDRLKDLIIRGGYNVYPREIEEVLYEHPDIVEAAVVGIPDDYYGQEVAAVVSLRPGSQLRGDELRLWLKERLSGYKVPRLFWFIDALPKGPTGKILKRALSPDSIVEGARAQAGAH